MEQQIQMYSFVEEWKSSNLTKGDFAAQKSLRYHSFNYWIKKYNKDRSLEDLQSDVSFFSAPERIGESKKVSTLKSLDRKAMFIELPNGIKITIY
ncbi:IS66 family insertion sequence element accessory protein TnpA [Flavobacterium sp.]|uniref:IS66 family insertion sequence element accessory protein TnpA n=1 Tax=Flavobacterium sp. TaxID=239 RepID=UPI00374CC8BE